jgi:hypothetical protein
MRSNNQRGEGDAVGVTYNRGSLEGVEGQRLGELGRDGRERRAHDAEEEAEVGPAERPAGAGGCGGRGHGWRSREVAADPAAEPLPPAGVLGIWVPGGEALRVGPLDERREGLPGWAQAAGPRDELLAQVLLQCLLRRRRRRDLAPARDQHPGRRRAPRGGGGGFAPRPRRRETPHHLLLERPEEPRLPLLLHARNAAPVTREREGGGSTRNRSVKDPAFASRGGHGERRNAARSGVEEGGGRE